MQPFSRLYALLLATTCGTSLWACDGEWTPPDTSTGSWGDSANWSNGCIPQADGDSASFGTLPSDPINLDIPVTLTDLTFNNPSTSYTINPSGGTMTLMSFNGVQPTINVLASTQTFNQSITTVSGDTLFLTVDGTLNINGGIGQSGSPCADLIIDGNGIINKDEGSRLVGNNYTQNSATINNFGFILANETLTMNRGILNNYADFGFGGPIIINGCTINNYSTFGYADPITINGGVFNNFHKITNNTAELVLNGGTLINEAGSSTIAVGSISIYGGTLINEGGNSNSDIYADSVTLYGGTLVNEPLSTFRSGGPITVNGGLFQNDGPVTTAPSTTVNAPGVVTGIGTFSMPFFNNGTVIPGDLPGPLSVDAYTQTAAGDLVINVLNSSVYGSLSSATTASLDGTLTVAPYPGFAGITPGTPLTIVTAPADVTGTFSSIVDLFGPSVRAQVTYLPTSVILQLYPQLSSFISFKEVAFSTINQIHLLLVNHMDRMVDPCCCPEYGFQFYLDPFGSSGKVHSQQSLTGHHFHTGGILAGFDMYLGEGGLGVAFDYERVYAKGFHNFGNFASNKYHLSAYATYLIDSCWQIDAIIGGGWESNQLRRKTGFLGNESTKGNPDGTSFDAFLGAEYLFNTGWCDLTLIPLAGLQYLYYEVDRFDEQGVLLFNYAFKNQNYDSLRSLLGFKLNLPYCAGCFQVVPQINVAWQYEFLDRSKTLYATNTDFALPTTSVFIPRGGQNILLAGADVALLYDRYTLDLGYEYEGNQRYYNSFFYLELAAAF